jgi:hypothetical protein
MKQRLLASLLLAVVGFCAPQSSEARQQPPAPLPAQPVPVAQDAENVREQLQEILRGYPRSVGEVLRRDPSLMARADYMAAYPALATFVQQHPEVPRNVEYYLEGYGSWGRQQFDPEFEALGVLLGGIGGFLTFLTVIGVLGWLVRAVILHRRWVKASQVQADVHTKLMERMTTNDELLAYIQSPAGRRFLEAAPIQAEAERPGLSAPVGSIMWAMMAGIVLATVGAGFRIAAGYVGDDAHEPFVVVGVIILSMGAGFVLAAGAAYLLSSRLGLFPAKPAPSDSSHA